MWVRWRQYYGGVEGLASVIRFIVFFSVLVSRSVAVTRESDGSRSRRSSGGTYSWEPVGRIEALGCGVIITRLIASL